ncbi:MAG: hypothetical protein L0332_25525 [Chloroflexi bacterium]|nr:hypothetical protein [Chloroflexota bacterium]MCI0730059.1 hypothetical protein [Chloroflexota bacterium]
MDERLEAMLQEIIEQSRQGQRTLNHEQIWRQLNERIRQFNQGRPPEAWLATPDPLTIHQRMRRFEKSLEENRPDLS